MITGRGTTIARLFAQGSHPDSVFGVSHFVAQEGKTPPHDVLSRQSSKPLDLSLIPKFKECFDGTKRFDITMAIECLISFEDLFHITYFTTILDTPPSWTPPHQISIQPQQHAMAPPHTQKSLEKEARMDLALHGVKKNQFSSQREAAKVWDVAKSTLNTHVRGTKRKRGSRAPNNLLSQIEEEELV